jgi:hypothetical protein
MAKRIGHGVHDLERVGDILKRMDGLLVLLARGPLADAKDESCPEHDEADDQDRRQSPSRTLEVVPQLAAA